MIFSVLVRMCTEKIGSKFNKLQKLKELEKPKQVKTVVKQMVEVLRSDAFVTVKGSEHV